MNIDIFSAIWGGSSKSYGEKEFECGQAELKSKYPTLTASNTRKSKKSKASASSDKITKAPEITTDSIIGIGLDIDKNIPQSIPVDAAPQTIAKSGGPPAVVKNVKIKLDLKDSKLSQLDLPGFSSQPRIGKRKLKAIKKKARDLTKGPKWFDMTAPEITDDRKNDLEALKMRSALDTKSFYKRNSVPIKPKHFQVGRIIETPQDFYNSRLTKKQRKRTIAEELMSELQD